MVHAYLKALCAKFAVKSRFCAALRRADDFVHPMSDQPVDMYHLHHKSCNDLGLQVEEFYVITWDAKKEQVFEMPTGGAAIMRSGPNLLKLARKEQCLALLSQLRTKFKTDGQFYRVFPDGEVQYLHPKDGVYPEKVNQGRQAVGANDRSIGKNPNPVTVSHPLAQVLSQLLVEEDRRMR